MEGLGRIYQATMDFLCPPPLSPIFQAGGALDGWNEDVCLIGAMMAVLCAIDVCFVTRWLSPKSRYFALHAFANAVSAVAAAPDVARGLLRPVEAFSGQSHTMVANSAVAAIHVYHAVAFNLKYSVLRDLDGHGAPLLLSPPSSKRLGWHPTLCCPEGHRFAPSLSLSSSLRVQPE